MSEKIIIFGGSFDPPHQGHKALVEHVKELFTPDRFIIVPCFIQPLKPGQSADPQSRLDMVKLLFGTADFLVSDHEIKKGDVSYSIDTIMHFKEIFKEADIYFLMGEDSLMNIKKWKDYERLLETCKYIVVSRTKGESDKLRTFAAELESRYETEIHVVDDFYHAASSTEIRAKLLNGIKPEYVNPNIFSYIRAHDLYRG
ncbi:MAG: nicotinate (nicotinamide) nucleotide adenylyltransferase [bacterium]